jgi:hypothetical protein
MVLHRAIENVDVVPPPRGEPVKWLGQRSGREYAGDFEPWATMEEGGICAEGESELGSF